MFQVPSVYFFTNMMLNFYKIFQLVLKAEADLVFICRYIPRYTFSWLVKPMWLVISM